MSDTPVTTIALDGLNLDRLLELRRQRRAIDAEIALLVGAAGATSLPTWGPCTRCGHVWQGRTQNPPRHCAGCASAYWDKEPRRAAARVPGEKRKKRSRGKRRVGIPPLEAGFDVVRLKKFSELPPLPDVEKMTPLPPSFPTAEDFEAAIRAVLPTRPVPTLPPPPGLTPPPPFLLRRKTLPPPPRYQPPQEEPQPESFAARVHEEYPATPMMDVEAVPEEEAPADVPREPDAAAAAAADAEVDEDASLRD
jgi:hypothetical protein